MSCEGGCWHVWLSFPSPVYGTLQSLGGPVYPPRPGAPGRRARPGPLPGRRGARARQRARQPRHYKLSYNTRTEYLLLYIYIICICVRSRSPHNATRDCPLPALGTGRLGLHAARPGHTPHGVYSRHELEHIVHELGGRHLWQVETIEQGVVRIGDSVELPPDGIVPRARPCARVVALVVRVRVDHDRRLGDSGDTQNRVSA